MSIHMKTATAMAVSTLLATTPLAAWATFAEYHSDTLTWTNGDITASPGTSWDGDGTSLEYTVYYDDVNETWKYSYEWSTDHKSLSHMIFSLTEEGDLGAFGYGDFLGGTEGGEIKYYGPDDMYGIKFDTKGDGLTAYFEIYTDRGPMWGDFYAKGGAEMLAVTSSVGYMNRHDRLMSRWGSRDLNERQQRRLDHLTDMHDRDLELLAMSEEEREGLGKKELKHLEKLERKMGPQGKKDREKAWLYAYNAGFGDVNEIMFNPDGSLAERISDQILVPDSFEGRPPAAIPLPAAAWLFVSGLLGLAGVTRRRKQV